MQIGLFSSKLNNFSGNVDMYRRCTNHSLVWVVGESSLGEFG